MRIDHLAIWVKDLEKMKDFYVAYFNATANDKYHNSKKGFLSYFLTFDSDCRLEIMHKSPILDAKIQSTTEYLGITHFSVSVGSKEAVDLLTNELRGSGYEIVGEPRTTGDGYYESVILDPENNRIEITI
ncbi:MAG: lactoylglutathione lyase [Saprospiraceae bacterium]|jgi:lactoylglutathione lyase